MKKLKSMAAMLAVTVMMLCAGSVNAQKNIQKISKDYTGYLKSQLTLNDSQAHKVNEITIGYLERVKKNKEAGTATEKAQKQKGFMEDRDKKMESVLSKEQYKIYIANRGANTKKLKEFMEAKAE